MESFSWAPGHPESSRAVLTGRRASTGRAAGSPSRRPLDGNVILCVFLPSESRAK